MILYNLELCVLFFGNSFITLIMVESLYNIKDLEGKAFVYGLGIALTVIFSVLPIRPAELGKIHMSVIIAGITIALGIVIAFPLIDAGPYSPSGGYVTLIMQHLEKVRLKKMMAEYSADEGEQRSAVSSDKLPPVKKPDTTVSTNSGIKKETTLSENTPDEDEEFDISKLPFEERIPYLYPVGKEKKHETIGNSVNIILIFMEGLSENIVDDPRGIMPNVAGIRSNSISFSNYYNHTFATYRGIEGQLYSGNSLNDLDTNSQVSLMDVLKVNGYYTSFINTEPNNPEFTEYLCAMPFDEVISDASLCAGAVDSVSDKTAYEKLFNTATAYNNEGKKFFLSMYSMGTHASFNSFDEVFGDGSSPFLNKFYNADCQFGAFFANYLNSPLASNTMVIFTTDHATYCDEDFVNNCPGVGRVCNGADRIPFFIYYQGRKGSVNANGRNSLDMAPTVLDLLGLEKPDNFLGESLYSPIYEKTILDTFFWNPDCIMNSGGGSIRPANADERKYVSKKMAAYFAIK